MMTTPTGTQGSLGFSTSMSLMLHLPKFQPRFNEFELISCGFGGSNLIIVLKEVGKLVSCTILNSWMPEGQVLLVSLILPSSFEVSISFLDLLITVPSNSCRFEPQ